MYSNNIVNFQESATISNACTKKSGNLLKAPSDVNIRIRNSWTAIDRLSIVRKFNFSHKIKLYFFQAVIVSVLLYGYTSWTLTKRHEKTLDRN